MKASDIKVLNIKSKYHPSENKTEILSKQSFDLERKPSLDSYSNKTNLFHDNSFFLDEYTIIDSPIDINENQEVFEHKNSYNSTFFDNDITIESPNKLAKMIQKQPIFPLENEKQFYVSTNRILQNDQHFSNNLPIIVETNNKYNKYDRKVARISAKTNYYRAKYQQLKVRKQLQINWRYCRKHISADCHHINQNIVDDNNNLVQNHEHVVTSSVQNKITDIRPTSIDQEQSEQFVNSSEEESELAELDDFDIFAQDFENSIEQKTKETNFLVEDSSFLPLEPTENQVQQNALNSIIGNNEQKKHQHLQINFVEDNPNEKRKLKSKSHIEEKLNSKIKIQTNQFETEDNLNFGFADPIIDEALKINTTIPQLNPLVVDQIQPALKSLSIKNKSKISEQKSKIANGIEKQNNKNISLINNKVIMWKSFLGLSLKLTLFATIVLAVCLGLLFKEQINNSNSHWNVIWFLNKASINQKNGWESFIYNNIFLITSLAYSFFFVFPLIIFESKKLFITSLILFINGLIVWTVFACFGFFKYHTFNINKTIATLELCSLIISWIVFTLFLGKLIRYSKQEKIKIKQNSNS